jgi:Flp pilus assembly protein TadG
VMVVVPERPNWLHDDEGAATTLSVVFMLPVLTLLLFAAVQAALWNHARTQAQTAARTTATIIARSGANPDDAQRDITANLAARTDLTHVTVTISRPATGGSVIVRVAGDAPGILVGTHSRIDVQVAVPLEGWNPL